jgi:Sulfotransferase family
MTDAIHLDDLARPRFTPDVVAMLAGMGGMAADCPLDAGRLHHQAMQETGLVDFGPRDYEERLEVLLGALQGVDGVTPAGQVVFYSQMLQLLKNRLLLTDLFGRHPEIHDIELAPPIIIVGLPRTGTTHLHNLLAADPALRPCPTGRASSRSPCRPKRGIEPGPRRQRAEAGVWFLNQAMPLFPLMHEITTDHVHEEIQLLAVDFSTMFFETLAPVPAWRSFYCSHDRRLTIGFSARCCRRSSSWGAGSGGCSSRPSTSSSFPCWLRCSRRPRRS